jgi:4-amino-4-deoxy-L-arabinose transferase-like glycosyltransferase
MDARAAASRYAWVLPVVIGLAVSAYFVTTLPTTPRVEGEGWTAPLGVKPLGDDAREYVVLADSIREDRVYEVGGEPSRARAPLYPLFIAVAGSAFGEGPRAVQWLQVLMVAGSIGLAYAIGRRAFSARAGMLAALLLAVYTPFTIRGALLMSEALFTLLFLGALLATLAAMERPRRRTLAATGALWALATLTRTVALPLPLLLAPVMLLALRGQGSRTQRLRSVALMLAAFVALLAPWTIRNAVVLGDFTPMPSQGGIALWAASHPDWRGFVDKHMAYAWELPEFFELTNSEHPSTPGADQRLTDAAWANIRADIDGWVSRNTAKLGVVVLASFPQEIEDAAFVRDGFRYAGWGGLVDVATAAAILLALVGVAASVRRRSAMVLFGVVAYFYAANFPTFVEPRYFLPLAPLYALFIAAALLAIAPYIAAFSRDAADAERARATERGPG